MIPSGWSSEEDLVSNIHPPGGARGIRGEFRYVAEEPRQEVVPIVLNPEPIRAPVQLAGEGPTGPLDPEEAGGSEEVAQK